MEYYCKRIIDTHVHIGGEKVGFIMKEEDVEYLIDKILERMEPKQPE